MKPRSREVTDGNTKAPARAMLRAVGMGDDDWDKPQIGVASSWNEITPCNLSLDRLAKRAKEGVHAAGGYPLEFGTISVSDGISMGHEGMRASLVSREVIADSVETVMFAERLDGSVLLAGCDKSLPGMLMAAARLDLASVFLYAGSTLPGQLGDRDLTIIDVFEGVGACAARADHPRGARRDRAGRLPGHGLVRRHVHRQHDGQRRRGARHGAARQRRAAGGRQPPRRDRRRLRRGRGQPAPQGHHRAPDHDPGGVRERDHRRAWRSAARPTRCCTCWRSRTRRRSSSTLDDFNRIGDRTPHLADVKPFGRYVMTDVDRIGGVPVVLRALLDAGLLHGDALTVTGKTMAENLAEIAPPDPDGAIIHAMNDADPQDRRPRRSCAARWRPTARW